jgi:hypothetical protein
MPSDTVARLIRASVESEDTPDAIAMPSAQSKSVAITPPLTASRLLRCCSGGSRGWTITCPQGDLLGLQAQVPRESADMTVLIGIPNRVSFPQGDRLRRPPRLAVAIERRLHLPQPNPATQDAAIAITL